MFEVVVDRVTAQARPATWRAPKRLPEGMSPGMHPTPHPGDSDQPQALNVPDLPAEEDLDRGRVSEDLADEPEEKRNATDDGAPDDEPAG